MDKKWGFGTVCIRGYATKWERWNIWHSFGLFTWKWFIEFRLFSWPKYFFSDLFFCWKLALTLCSVCIIVSIKMYSQGEHLIFSIIMSMSCLDNKKGKEDWLLRLKASEKKWRRNDKIIILGHTVIQKKWELSKDIIERWCRNKGNSSSF